MRRSIPAAICVWLLSFACCLSGSPAIAQQSGDDPELKLGDELFHRDWLKHVIQDRWADGLGPLYNATSCVACHGQGGSGGGGDNKHNVILLTLSNTVVPKEEASVPISAEELRDKPKHPGLSTTSSIVLHRFGKSEDYATMFRMWTSWQPVEILGGLVDPNDPSRTSSLANLPKIGADEAHALALMRSERNTPSLFGLGLLDSIPTRALERIAKYQDDRHRGISGRVAPRGGKFGWRGQTTSVRNFVLGACANELGLQTPGFPQPQDPAHIVPGQQPNNNSDFGHDDLNKDEVNALVKYVEQLPPPEQIRPTSVVQRTRWTEGRKHFTAAKCDACHVRQIGTVVGLYSDLLLHDMGEKLSDPAALSSSGSPTFQYYGTGSSLVISDEQKQEWRTPPLWGVRDSAPYLHDGSAATLEDAILAHGGEAESSRIYYERLSAQERRLLVSFVHSLGATDDKPYLAKVD